MEEEKPISRKEGKINKGIAIGFLTFVWGLFFYLYIYKDLLIKEYVFAIIGLLLGIVIFIPSSKFAPKNN